MAYYTLLLKDLILKGFDIGLDDYPIFDEAYRKILNDKIINHYGFREIGFDVPNRFKHELNTKMHEIMPYYNQLYINQNKILAKELDHNTSLKEEQLKTAKSDANSSSASNNSGSNKNKMVFQDTPNNELIKSNIDELNYATNFSLNESESINGINDETVSKVENSEDYVKMITGNNGTKYSIETLSLLRSNLMNIDLEIINNLSDLFMGLWM